MDKKRYLSIQKSIDTGDLIEWRSKTIIGRMIRFFTKKEVNHSSLCIRLETYRSYGEPHRFILEANPGGIELHLLSRAIETHKGTAYYYRLPMGEDSNVRKRIAEWALLQVGTKYDYKSLFKNILGHVNADSKRFFCSEFVFMAYKYAGILEGEKAPRPGEFEKFNLFFKREQL